MRIYSFFIAFLAICGVLMLHSCLKPEDINPNAPLVFSQDTVRFDTVFVARGSATRYFKIKNKRNTDIKVSEIRLAGGQASQYRINIDGSPVLSARDVEIAANDSLYVFVQVNIDPNNANAPFIVTDSVTTVIDGVQQRVILEAFGQNAIYVGSRAGGAHITQRLNNNIWDSPKPYVIYGWLVVDTCRWVVKPGTRIYVHGGIVNKNGLFTDKKAYPYFDGLVYIDGTASVSAEGTFAQPILFAGDRLEHDKVPSLASLDYSQTPSQWTGIFLGKDSKNNKFSYCRIKNAGFGVRADSNANVALKNCVINNHSAYAIAARHPEFVTAENCLFFSSNDHLLPLTFGGTYTFTHCTMGCFGSPDYIKHDKKSILALSNSFCEKYDDSGNLCVKTLYNDLNATFTNCIIYGSLPDEIALSKATQAAFNVTFTNCLMKRTTATLNDSVLNNCIFPNISSSALFKDVDKLDYHVGLTSAAAGKAAPSALTTDLEDKPRLSPSAIGCYEAK
jgi:hypothetical protein